MTATIRLCHLYPREMNIYADRGNIAVFRRRSQWRNMTLEVVEAGPGDPIDPEAHDLYYLGGGQDRDQAAVAEDLVATKADALRSAFADGAVGFFVCGGIQLAGHRYVAVDGSTMTGIGVLDLETRAEADRLIGDVVAEATLNGETETVVGYENHAGRTQLGAGAEPFARVITGHGNNGTDATEGAVAGRVLGTYLHGPLLPRNPWLADTLLGWALQHGTGQSVHLTALDDDLEERAREVARRRARVRR